MIKAAYRLANDKEALTRLLELLVRYQHDIPSELRKEVLAIIEKNNHT